MAAQWPEDPHRNRLCERVKEVVREVEPGAEVVLFGSRARGDAGSDSDWDLLILLEGAVDQERKKTVWHRLWDLELDLEEVICPLVMSRQNWETPLYQAMPIHQNIDRDGIVL